MKMSFVDRLTAVAAKFGAQRHLAAIRDGFVSLMPLIIAGSFALIIKNLPLPTVEKWQAFLPEFVINICNMVWWGTIGMLTLFAVFSIAYHLAKSYNVDGLGAGFIALASYIALTPQVATAVLGDTGLTADQVVSAGTLDTSFQLWGNLGFSYTSANSLFIGIIVALVATEIFVRFSRIDKLTIKLPAGVPPAVGRSFSILLPATITITAVAVIGLAVHEIIGKDVFTLITDLFAPLVSGSDTLIGAIVIVLLNQILWSFGLHGSNIIGGVYEPISLKLMTENMEAFANGDVIPHIVTKPFLDAYVHLGGSGATLGLVIAIFLISRTKLNRTLGKTSIGPGLFNINEPVIFGMPIVLNPVLIIPFVVGPLILTITSYYALAWGWVDKTVALIPWTTPPFLSGWMVSGGDWHAIILQAVNIAIAILIYLPFVRIVDQLEQKREAKAR